jgi:hypothetical protein
MTTLKASEIGTNALLRRISTAELVKIKLPPPDIEVQ